MPVLLIVTLVVAQLAVAGYALWSAGERSRGARVTGRRCEAAARSLPAPLRHGVHVSDSNGVEVRVRAPALLPGILAVPVTARAGLDAGDG